MQSSRAKSAFNDPACKLQFAEPLIATVYPVPRPGSQNASGANPDVTVLVMLDVNVLVTDVVAVVLAVALAVVLPVPEAVLLPLLLPVELAVLDAGPTQCSMH